MNKVVSKERSRHHVLRSHDTRRIVMNDYQLLIIVGGQAVKKLLCGQRSWE